MRVSFFATVISFCVTILTGCSGILATPVPMSVASAFAPGTAYRAFGDSITAGVTLGNPALAYPALIAKDYQFDLSNYAIGGSQACDVPTTQIFANSDNIFVGATPLYTILIGTNDEDTRYPDYYSVFTFCHQAAIAWLAIPPDLKVLATSDGVVTTGPGVLETANNWNAWETSTQNSSIAFPIDLPAPGPIYIWPRILDYDLGSFTYALDGTVLGTFNTSPNTIIRTSNGVSSTLAFIRLPNVTAGHHVVKFTQISVSGTMRIVAIATPPATTHPLATVLVGNPPLQEVGSSAPCNIVPVPCVNYLAQIQADVTLFAGDGLNVQFVDNHPYMHATLPEMNDTLHPNPLGQTELHTAFETAIP
jgi:hypothetical protein